MDWDKKTRMIQLGNKYTSSIEDKTDFQNYILENIQEFDGQSWDMFSNLIVVDIEQMKENIEFWKKVYEYLKTVDSSDEKFGFRSGLRLLIIQTICEDELKLNN